jgi:hypothetical protein
MSRPSVVIFPRYYPPARSRGATPGGVISSAQGEDITPPPPTSSLCRIAYKLDGIRGIGPGPMRKALGPRKPARFGSERRNFVDSAKTLLFWLGFKSELRRSVF